MNQTQSDETKICLSCGEINPIKAERCASCGTLIGNTATLDPIKYIDSCGSAVHKSATRPIRFVQVLGVWLIFLPQVLVIVFLLGQGIWQWAFQGGVVDLLMPGGQLDSVSAGFRILLMVFLFGLYLYILKRVTANYLARRST